MHKAALFNSKHWQFEELKPSVKESIVPHAFHIPQGPYLH